MTTKEQNRNTSHSLELFFESHVVRADYLDESESRYLKNDPVFHATDVAEILGYANPHDAILRFVDGADLVERETRNARNELRPAKFLRLAGVFTLIGNSEAPNAKPVQKWMFSEVMPNVTLHGGYSSNPESAIGRYFKIKATGKQHIDKVEEQSILNNHQDIAQEMVQELNSLFVIREHTVGESLNVKNIKSVAGLAVQEATLIKKMNNAKTKAESDILERSIRKLSKASGSQITDDEISEIKSAAFKQEDMFGGDKGKANSKADNVH